jgi:hypothetical protein
MSSGWRDRGSDGGKGCMWILFIGVPLMLLLRWWLLS